MESLDDDYDQSYLSQWDSTHINLQNMRNGFIDHYIYSAQEIEDMKMQQQ